MEPKRKVTQDEYDEVLESHCVFLLVQGGGLRMEFENCDLVGIIMRRGADLTGAKFINCDLQGNRFQDVTAVNAEFTGSNLSDAQFYSCDISRATLVGVNLDGAEIVNGKYTGAQFRSSSMTGTSFLKVGLTKACFGGVKGQGAVFRECDASYATYTDSTWVDGFMTECKFKKATFEGATFQAVDFFGSDFRDATINADSEFLRCGMWDVQGNNGVIRSYQLPRWTVVVCRDQIQIGCQSHPLKAWMGFDNEEISQMSDYALHWWGIYKSLVMQLAKLPER